MGSVVSEADYLRYDAGQPRCSASPYMVPLIKSYYELLMMRLPPQALPASRLLLVIAVIAFGLVSMVNHYLLAGELHYAVGRGALSILNLSVGAGLILLITRRIARWPQTLTALLGGSALLGAMLLPVVMVYVLGIQNIFISLSILAFNVWELVFFGHVYRNALDTEMGVGIAVSLIYLITSFYIKGALLPLPGGAP